MAILNLKKRQIECKIVYYGPGRCGKTTNMEHIYKSYKKQVTGEMISIDTEGDRTLFFDFLPMGLGVVEGSLASFFSIQGIEVSLSLTLVIIIRLFTRWYGVAAGFVALKLSGGLTFADKET